jgi:hypothetical protein
MEYGGSGARVFVGVAVEEVEGVGGEARSAGLSSVHEI